MIIIIKNYIKKIFCLKKLNKYISGVLGIGYGALGPIPNPQSPIPKFYNSPSDLY
jgi:hypothetical protein